jgi:hypothetical protein
MTSAGRARRERAEKHNMAQLCPTGVLPPSIFIVAEPAPVASVTTVYRPAQPGARHKLLPFPRLENPEGKD